MMPIYIINPLFVCYLISWINDVIADAIPHVNGFVHLTFSPPSVVLSRGGRVTGVVNISIDQDVTPREYLTIHPCCLNNDIAKLMYQTSYPVRNNSAFYITLEGNNLGRNELKFWVAKKNSSAGPLITNSNLTDWWWAAYTYDVIVKDGDHSTKIGFYVKAIILGLMALNLIGVGGQLDGDEIIVLLKNPAAISIGLMCRFGVLPAVALGIVELIRPERNTSLGLLSLICSPSEGATNLLVLLAEADLTFSATLTAVNNFASVGMLPLWAILFETRIYTSAGNIKIPFKETFAIFGYIVLALALGFLLHRKLSNLYHTFWTYLPSFTIFTLIAAIIVEIYTSNFIFNLVTKEVFFTCALMACSGYAFGAMIAFITQQSHPRILVMCIEAGTRTSFVTCTLLQMSLEKPEADMAKTAPVLCVLMALIPAFLLTIFLRVYKRFVGVRDYMEATVDDTPEDAEDSLPVKNIPEPVNEKETCM